MNPAGHYREAERLLEESEATLRLSAEGGASSGYKDRRAARLRQLAEVHALLAQVGPAVAVEAMHLPDPVRPRRPLVEGGPSGVDGSRLQPLGDPLGGTAVARAMEVLGSSRPKPGPVKPHRPPTSESGVSAGPDGAR